jgi:hypothetical protein
MSKPSEALVWINDDGSARELTDAEKKYVDKDFSPFDGARPYIKSNYEMRNGWGELKGFLLREKVPHGVAIAPAPHVSPEPPQTPQEVANSIVELIRKHRPD